MSVLGKKWVIKNKDQSKNTLEKILQNRGLLNVDSSKVFNDPFSFRDMEIAVERIKKAIENNERIIVFGDYDVDGITGTAILVHILRKLKANVSYRLPNRVNDGYGLAEKFIDDFIQKDVKLLITVDCGISCKKEIEKAYLSGIETIITDHHTIPENGVPKDAVAILHPKEKDSSYPFKGLTGAGVALKLAQALIQKFLKDDQENILNSLIDLASLGTIADLGPIKGENWWIVKKGLENLGKTKWIGLKKIMEMASIKANDEINSDTIGYKIAPRINAAGRIGDPYIALSLLLAEDPSERINILGKKLEELNSKRQLLTIDAFREVENFLINKSSLPYIFLAENEKWHVGILGLIAGKLAEKYARPSIIMQDFGDMLVGSARSPEYFNIIEAISLHKDLLISFGGHEQAAGFNIKKENLKTFKEKISIYAKNKLKNIELKSILEIDCSLNDSEIDIELLNQIDELKPFGIENSKPTFLLEGIEPYFIEQVGKEKNHLKFLTRICGEDISVIAFRMGEFANDLRKHKKIDIVFHLERNIWRNKEKLQIQALDFKLGKE